MGGKPVGSHGYSEGVPSRGGPSLRALGMDGLDRWSPHRRGRPGSRGWTHPLISQKALLRLPPGYGCHWVGRLSSVRRAPCWVVGEYGEDLRVGQHRLWRIWEHRRRVCLRLGWLTLYHRLDPQATIQKKIYGTVVISCTQFGPALTKGQGWSRYRHKVIVLGCCMSSYAPVFSFFFKHLLYRI